MRLDRATNPAFITAMAVMVTCAVGMGAAIKAYGIFLEKLPVYAEGGRLVRAVAEETERWRRAGPDRIESEATLETLGTDNYLTRDYIEKSPKGAEPRRLTLHLAYYTGMIDTVPHVPEVCFVGGGLDRTAGPFLVPIPMDTSGWTADDGVPPDFAGRVYRTRLSNEWSTDARGRRVRLPIGLTPESPLMLRVTQYQDGQSRSLWAGYFFIANGGFTASAFDVRRLAFKLTDDYAYFLKVQVTSADVTSQEELGALAGELLDELLGEVMLCVPDWVEVERGTYPPDNPKRPRTTE